MTDEAVGELQIAFWPRHRGHYGIERVIAEKKPRIILLPAGRRWRKTSWTLRRATMRKLRRGKRVLWVSANSEATREAWDELRAACSGIPEEIIQFHRTFNDVYFHTTGGVLRLRSMEEPGNVRSRGTDLAVFDEAGRRQFPHEAWHIVGPMLSDPNSDGEAILPGTPEGMTWWADMHYGILDGKVKDAVTFQIPTLGFEIVDGELLRKPHPLENPDFKFEELERWFNLMTERTFRQEFGAEFLSDAGGVFRLIEEMATAPWPVQWSDRETYCAGLDIGYTGDPTVLEIGSITRKQSVDFDRFSGVTGDMLVERVVRRLLKWRPKLVWADKSSLGLDPCERIARRLNGTGIDFIAPTTTNMSKDQWVEYAAAEIEKGRWRYPKGGTPEGARGGWETFRQEMSAYQLSSTPTGLRKYGAPPGKHDDCVEARIRMLQAAKALMAQAPPPEEPRPFEPAEFLPGKLRNYHPPLALDLSKVVN